MRNRGKIILVWMAYCPAWRSWSSSDALTWYTHIHPASATQQTCFCWGFVCVWESLKELSLKRRKQKWTSLRIWRQICYREKLRRTIWLKKNWWRTRSRNWRTQCIRYSGLYITHKSLIVRNLYPNSLNVDFHYSQVI